MPTERPLTGNMRADGEALDREAYERAGGYQALRKALQSMTPEAVTEEVKASNLRGRGGAGFPTGLKWSFHSHGKDAPHPRYLVANADEMEPGTFKDRLLLEGDPHQLIEGMTLAGYATGTDVAYIFLRGEYKLAARAIAEGHRGSLPAGYLGKEHSGLRLQPRVVPARQRRPLHVRRRDRDAERPRRQARQPARQAAVPAGFGTLWQADHRQQRRDALQRAAHHQQRRGVVQEA